MKIIVYKIDTGEENFCTKTIPYSEENLTMAEMESGGDYTIEDDGAEKSAQPTTEDLALDLLADHEYRLCMLELSGEVSM